MRISEIPVQKIIPKHLGRVHPRSAFIALNAAAVLVLAGSGAAYAGLTKEVDVTLDGQPTTIRTFDDTVGSALESSGIELAPSDQVTVDGRAANSDAPVARGTKVSVNFAKPVTVAVDGKTKRTVVHDDTVGDVLDGMDIEPQNGAYVSAKRNVGLARSGTQIVISNPKTIEIKADGRSQELKTTAPTTAAALKEAGIKLDDNDEVVPAIGAFLSDGDKVKVTRIKLVNKTEEVALPQPIEYKDDKNLEKGLTKVITAGTAGRARQKVLVTVADGEERSRLVLRSKQLSASTIKVMARGTAVSDADDNSVWDKIAKCESGGNWHINTGNGYYGGLQFSAATWKSVGGPGLPHENSREVQIKYAKILQKRSGWGQWGCAHARFN